MSKILFVLYLLSGKIEKVDGLYTIHTPEKSVIEYACKGEVLHYIETGEFHYDDFLCKSSEVD